ncbi:hypothetical protein FHX64_002497 [Microbacter margulisiae]|uniref:Uncharacterized protein n=1 Tax=Microbacter margulisiae TaxID=1350067 RepID=A0A7W5H371_9PORP|nr:hypothetical protein [Microbacter margulisiae]
MKGIPAHKEECWVTAILPGILFYPSIIPLFRIVKPCL